MGGPGVDRILGGGGNDTIFAEDGEREPIECGSGYDVLYFDPALDVSLDRFSHVFTMRADGSRQKKRSTTDGSFDANPAWSPDGTQIAFSSDGGGGDQEIYTMDAVGTNPTNLTNNTANDSWPDWQPT